MNSNDRTEASMSSELFTALFAGTCKSIITERVRFATKCKMMGSSETPSSSAFSLSEDYTRGGAFLQESPLDPQFPSFLSSLSCFRYLSSFQISQLVPLFTPVEFRQHEYSLLGDATVESS